MHRIPSKQDTAKETLSVLRYIAKHGNAPVVPSIGDLAHIRRMSDLRIVTDNDNEVISRSSEKLYEAQCPEWYRRATHDKFVKACLPCMHELNGGFSAMQTLIDSFRRFCIVKQDLACAKPDCTPGNCTCRQSVDNWLDTCVLLNNLDSKMAHTFREAV